ncbi:sensor histidine kinase [Paenibacillus eucommiae]|uniref:histidine kinase n=1 Tax=Paenibacillus eucommiae TaxID=1355755 RepID=A0ABS4J5K3_9BACL|nr:sensor histidine kinase [Paenibacillus eucommiae]MBP1995085.1 two-component system sensor histidine kinase LytS [Paenibacillus eucommiae]
MIYLLPLMLERVGIIVIAAFLLSQMKSFRQMVHYEHKTAGKIQLIAVFGCFGIISNYTGVEISGSSIVSQTWLMEVDPDNAIANTRVMGVGMGGLLGGPLVGLGAGLIAGLHRYTLGGFTAGACAVSSILAGLAAGYLGRWYRKKGLISPWFAVVVGLLMEVVQMVIILLTAKPYEAAWKLVQMIGIPMIIFNGFGTLVFMFIIQSILREEERTRALQTHKAFYIADQTLPFFRQGLNPQSCKSVAQVMLKLTVADAIAITNDHQVLAHVGEASDHHIPMQKLATGLTRSVLEQGTIMIAKSKKEIDCFDPHCILQAAVVLPLQVHNRTVGTLKLYFKDPSRLSQVEQQLAEGLAKLFSTQLELAEAELQSKLLKDAKIKALQVQVHPHFLFNAINTISALCRTDPEKARKLLLELSVFFRSNLQGAHQWLITLEKELEHVKAYLSLEQARFPNKYTVVFDIEPGLETISIPPFVLQPLVENAIRHAFSQVKSSREVRICAYSKAENMYVTVEDNGKGITEDKLGSLGKQTVDSIEGTGTALYNIQERLEGIYRDQASFRIESEPGKGTKVQIIVPLHGKQEAYEEC